MGAPYVSIHTNSSKQWNRKILTAETHPLICKKQTQFVIRLGIHDSRGYQGFIFMFQFASNHSLYKQYLTFILLFFKLFLFKPSLPPPIPPARSWQEMWSIWVRNDSWWVRQRQALYWLLLWSSGNEPKWDFFIVITPSFALE